MRNKNAAMANNNHAKKPSDLATLIKTIDILCLPSDEVLRQLGTSLHGLTDGEAKKRLDTYGPNEAAQKKERALIVDFLSRFMNPLVLILIGAAIISALLGEHLNSSIIFLIVLISVALDFFQEYRAGKAAEELRKRVSTTATSFRSGVKQDIAVAELVLGDIIALSAGDIVPADAIVINSKDFFVDQSALTGESFPVEKTPTPLEEKAISDLTTCNNYLLMGTSVVSGSSLAVVLKTGESTEYGRITRRSVERRPITEFERGLRGFGFLVMRITFVLVIFVFFINALFRHGILDSLLFAVALAVGLTPELLPMILSLNLSRGAIAMSKKGTIVKRLASIQNFGSMDVLCTDKTGTLTENRVTVILHIDIKGHENEKVFLYSFLNSTFQTGLRSPLDEAVLRHEEVNIEHYQKVDEIPFDFVRRRISVIVNQEKERFIITKGAPEEVAKASSHFEFEGMIAELTSDMRKELERKYYELSSDGFRVVGISYKEVTNSRSVYSADEESNMVFLGFIAFIDPPKETAKESLQLLRKAGVELKIVTGDNDLVTKNICQHLDFEIKRIVLGNEIDRLADDALAIIAEKANIFARVTPMQKNRIMNALKSNGHVVGFLGDGINDTPSMKVADVSISVDNAVDIAKESADIILLHKDLKVLQEGVLEGRKTFANTMKYIFTTTSANFGNMLSAAGASLFLPFLPLLPVQILLNNFLSDIPALALATDNVDPDWIERPHRWDGRFVRNFVIIFGAVSSVFDYLTFALLLFVINLHDVPPPFRTAWFIESLMTELFVALVVRTRKVFFRSKPGKYLLISSLVVAAVTIAIPYLPYSGFLGFVPLPPWLMATLLGITMLYMLTVEVAKRFFYARLGRLEQGPSNGILVKKPVRL